MVALLEAQALDFCYPGLPRPALTSVSLAVARGELWAIVGPNGAGKSTLLRLLAGLLRAKHGEVRFDGRPLAAYRRRQLARRLAYVPQELGLVFPFTVAEVVLMGRYPHRAAHSLEDAGDLEQARLALARTDMLELAGRRFDELSGGERRRAVLAQALCQTDEAILLDEPTAALDPAHQMAVFATLRQLRHERGTTVVAVTHDLNLALRFADRVALLDQGKLAACAAPEEVLTGEATRRAFQIDLYLGRVPGSDAPFIVPR